jgi:uridine kinase
MLISIKIMENIETQNNNQKIIDFLVNLIEKFSAGREKTIIGIEGASGIGKTTIINLIQKNNDSFDVLHTDLFHNDKEYKGEVLKTLKKKSEVFEKGWFDSKKILNAIETFKKDSSKKVLIIDGVFLHNKEIFGDAIDKIIYLKSDENLVLKRRGARLKNYDDNQKLFLELFDVAWKNYIEKFDVDNKSDAVITFV